MDDEDFLPQFSSVERKSVEARHHHVIRPLCPCCGGGEIRKGYAYSKYTSRKRSTKARRAKKKIDRDSIKNYSEE